MNQENLFTPPSETTPSSAPMARPVDGTHAPYASPPPKQPKPRWQPLRNVTKRDAVLDLLFVVAVLIGVAMVIPSVVAMMFNQSILDIAPSPTFLIFEQAIAALTAVTFLIYLRMRTQADSRDFGLTGIRPHWSFVPLWVPASVFGCYLVLGGMLLFFGLLVMMFPEIENALMENQGVQERFFSIMPKSRWLVVALMIPVAIHEEIIFRALMLPYLKRITGHWWLGVLISSVIFGALHIDQGPFALVPLMLIGAVLAITFILTRSLLVVILAHASYNVLQMIIAPYLFDLAEKAAQTQGG